ncbi:T9SS type A sorting domain-containing protein [Pontibacter sp. Tf4]|uniref:T9SS type A sorting domain-containing protein n=1 Tax=Pontibacter sp. Tf4 TaxID=2761620 RepID=UPI001629D5B7|nr:T9SS type A sorting domain-containing protein [Pontibacter sp. Tf4]MBB6611228.1 T9SS type A sorting domain-containing protein [Pontibacter sp. Tf4]
MKNFTKLVFISTLLGSHLLGLTAMAASVIKAEKAEAASGVAPTYKGGSTLWKLKQEKSGGLVVSAQNARPIFVASEAEHTCSKIYAAAVGPSFHIDAPKPDKSMYASVTLASFTPIRDVKTVPSINAYPNPSNGPTRLTLTQSGSDNYKIRISNTIGRVIFTKNLAATEAKEVTLDMSPYPSGVYFYSLLVNDKTVETKRLILQK